MSLTQHSFTPVRRREETVNSQRYRSHDSNIWTASKCHRLLRPLRSRVELLRKDRKQYTSGNMLSQEPLTDGQFEHDIKGELRTSDASDYHESDQESDWEKRRRKRVRRTYGARQRSGTGIHLRRSKQTGTASDGDCTVKNLRTQSIPGEIIVPTPIISKIKPVANGAEPIANVAELDTGKAERTRRPQARYLTRDGDAHFKLSENLRQLRKTIDTSTFTLYDGIYNALETLLKATKSNGGVRECHSRSLFSTCLRNIPNRIKEEEQWSERDAEKQGLSILEMPDVSGQTYCELESLGTSVEGWHHLRSVVRAHGIQYVSEAVSERLIDTKFAGALVMLCVHTESLDAAESVLEAILDISEYQWPKAVTDRFEDYPALLPLVILEEYTQYTGRTAFHHRQLTRLISTGLLPITWLTTNQLSTTWITIFQSISNGDLSGTGSNLMMTVLCSMVEQFRGLESSSTILPLARVLKIAFGSVLRTLCAMSLLKQPESYTDSERSSAETDSSCIIRELLLVVAIHCGTLTSEMQSSPIGMLAASALLCTSEWENTDIRLHHPNDIRTFVSAVQTISNDVSDISLKSFLLSISSSCGKGAANDGFEYVKLCLDRIVRVSTFSTMPLGNSLRQVAVDTAYAFSQQTHQRAHLEYAESLGTGAYISNAPEQALSSTCTTETSMHFRWEEGISEWVTATPVAKAKTAFRGHNSTRTLSVTHSISPFKPMLGRRGVSVSAVSESSRGAARSNINRGRLSDMVPDTPDAASNNTKLESNTRVDDSSPFSLSRNWCETSYAAFGDCLKGCKRPGISNWRPSRFDDGETSDLDDSGIFLDNESDDELNAFTFSKQKTELKDAEKRPPLTERVNTNLNQPRYVAASNMKRTRAFAFQDDSEDELSGF